MCAGGHSSPCCFPSACGRQTELELIHGWYHCLWTKIADFNVIAVHYFYSFFFFLLQFTRMPLFKKRHTMNIVNPLTESNPLATQRHVLWSIVPKVIRLNNKLLHNHSYCCLESI